MLGAEVLTRFTADTKDFDKKVKGLNTSVSSIAKGVLAATGITKAFSTAWGMVSSNLGTAINRYDKLQNFPKVMKNFGVSSEEAAKSIDRIADSILGLPTTLDQAAEGVQNIFMVTKDLKKAEDMFQAINDSAMVFASGSTEAVDRFIYAYKQAMSSGKVMAQDFNQMNEAIPGLMDKVAESMGVTFAELKEGLSNGTISTDQFNAALKRLDTEGTASMGALRESAFNATGGIGTALTNMNSRIAAGLASMIEAVNKGLKEAGLGDLATIFSNIGTSIKNMLISLAPYITEAIIKTKEIFDFISKNQETIKNLATAIGILVAAIKIYNLNVKITNTLAKINAETHIFTKAAMLAQAAATKLVTAAQAGLNLVMSLNPIVLVIAAIVALIAVFVVLWNKCEWFRNFWIGLWDGLKNKVKNVIDSIGNFVKGVKDIGLNIVKGIGNGITSGITWIKNKIRDFVGNVTSFIKKLFKIGSPSKLMENEIGQWIPKGIAVGISANTSAIDKSMKEVQSSINASMSPSLNPSSSMHYSPNVNVYNNVDVKQDPLGQMVNNIKTYSGGAKNDYNYGAGF